MRAIYKIARLELANLFYSPVAWLLLVLFMYMTGSGFGEMLERISMQQEMGYGNMNGISAILFHRGLWRNGIDLFYMIMPLLTMGLISQEFNRGSVKLLFSAPITGKHIVLGKYLGIMLYGLLMMGILLMYVLIAGFTVESFDWSYVLSGLLGLFLLYAVYAAIGLFMSALTTYQIVAAIGMLALLTFLNMVSGIWQDFDFVRDVTYWLSIGGRVQTFVRGMICTEDVFYFVIIAVMFLWFTMLRIQFYREICSLGGKVMRYLGVFAVAMLLGYLSSRPMMKAYYDGTYTKENTLTEESQDIVSRLDGGLKITTYVNLFRNTMYSIGTKGVNDDLARYENYVRFKPETDFKYVYYYHIDTTTENYQKRYPNKTFKKVLEEEAKMQNTRLGKYLSSEEIHKEIDLSDEGYRFVSLIERENGQKMFLRVFNDGLCVPSEQEISAALKRLVMKLPRVGFVADRQSRSITGNMNRDYTGSMAHKYNRNALINQGFDVVDVHLDRGERELDSLEVLVVAEPLEAFSEEELAMLNRYIENGGNMLVAGKAKTASHLAPLMETLGLRFEPGILVQHEPVKEYTPNILLCWVPDEAQDLCRMWNRMHGLHHMEYWAQSLVMTDAAGLKQAEDKGFRVMPIAVTRDSSAWNEMETIDFVNEVPQLNEKLGETAGIKTTMMALEREKAGKKQRIIVTGDAHSFSMGGLIENRRGISSNNSYLIMGMFNWLSYDELPLDMTRPKAIDNRLNMSMATGAMMSVTLKWILPALLLLLGIVVLIRRKGK